MKPISPEQKARIFQILESGEKRTKLIRAAIEREFGRDLGVGSINRFLCRHGIHRRNKFPDDKRLAFMRLCAENAAESVHVLIDRFEADTGFRVPLERAYQWKFKAKRQEAA